MLSFIAQAEVAVHFLMGTLDISNTYCDDPRKIAYKYLTAPAGFWLDVITSLPWSFNDVYSSQVPSPISLQMCYRCHMRTLVLHVSHTLVTIRDILGMD